MSASGLNLDQLLARLRFAHLEHIGGDLASSAAITAIAGVDEHGQPSDGLLVLGIGLEDEAAVRRAWTWWNATGAVALVVRTALLKSIPVEPNSGTADGLSTTTVLLGIGEEMSWLRLAAMVASDLDRAHLPTATSALDSHGISARDDLYTMANSLSALLGGPVTIEDLGSRIVAFSADQDQADEHRKRSILERRVSTANSEVLEREGVFSQLYSSPVPIFFQPNIAGASPRTAMRIRYGGETLGSIWAMAKAPPTPLQELGLVEASNVLALSIMRDRLLDQTRNEKQHREVVRLLAGGAEAVDAAISLNVADVPTYVMALTLGSGSGDLVRDEIECRRFARLVTTFTESVNRRVVVAPVGSTVYVVVPFAAGSPDPALHADEARRFGGNLMQRLGDTDLVLGIGDLTADASQLSRSRRQADVAARVLRLRKHDQCRGVGYWRDLQVDSLLLEVVDSMIARHEPLTGPLAPVLLDGDTEHLETLRAYLDRLGDITTAAADVFVHPNTFRYRLRKISERRGIDLDDPETRFAVMLQFRIHDWRQRLSESTSSGTTTHVLDVVSDTRGARARDQSE